MNSKRLRPQIAQSSLRTVSLTVLPLVLSALLGCSGGGDNAPKKYKITGTVTLDGRPLPDGYVRFAPEDGLSASDAAKIKDGSYLFEALPGPKKVFISASRIVAGKSQEDFNPGSGNDPVYEQYIPAKYSGEQTELSATVKESDNNQFNFELVSK